MSPRLRRVIYALFVALFAVTVPLVLLWTAGYRWNWQRHRVQKTGLLQIETAPRGASVSIDGTVQKRTTPATYSRLLPKDYDVRVSRDGYLPWEKTLEVTSSRTTFVSALVLYRDVLPRLGTEKNALITAWDGEADKVAYVAESEGVKEVGFINASGNDTLLARFPGETVKNEVLTWSPSGNDVLFTATVNDAARAYRYSIATSTLTPLHDLFAKGRLKARWTDDGGIAVTDDTGAYAINADGSGKRAIMTAKRVMDADVRNRSGIVLQTDDPEFSAFPDEPVALMGDTGTLGTNAYLDVARFPAGNYAFEKGSDGFHLIRDIGRRRLILVQRGVKVTTPATFDATGYEWEPGGNRLLIWNDFEISIISPATNERELVTRLGTAILQASWSPQRDAVLYATPTGIFAAELDGRDRRNVFELARCSETGAFALQREAGLLHLACTIGSRRGFFVREL
jgi:hypothetical protein